MFIYMSVTLVLSIFLSFFLSFFLCVFVFFHSVVSMATLVKDYFLYLAKVFFWGFYLRFVFCGQNNFSKFYFSNFETINVIYIWSCSSRTNRCDEVLSALLGCAGKASGWFTNESAYFIIIYLRYVLNNLGHISCKACVISNPNLLNGINCNDIMAWVKHQ